MKFYSLDVETANYDSSSICQIGIGLFVNGELADTWESLIDPQSFFHWSNIRIHGITEDEVQGAPSFGEVYPLLRRMLSDHIVIHHTPFDFHAFSKAYARFNLKPIDIRWLDSSRIVRHAWSQFSKAVTTWPMSPTILALNSNTMMRSKIRWLQGKSSLRHAGLPTGGFRIGMNFLKLILNNPPIALILQYFLYNSPMRRNSGKRSTSGSGKSPRSGRSSGSRKGRLRFQGNIILVMLLKLLLVLLLLFFSRVLFYAFNLGYFSNLGFMEAMRLCVIGIRFDLSALLIINAPFIIMNTLPFKFRYNRIYQGFSNAYFYVINAFALFTNFGDTIYFRFTLKRLTADIFNYVGVGGDFDKLIPQFLHDFWYVAVVWVLFVAILIYFGSRFVVSAGSAGKKGSGIQFFVLNAIVFVAVMVLSVIGIRGGLQLRPIGLVTAGNYTSAKNMPLVLNTPFSIAKSINKERLKPITVYKKEHDLAKIYSPLHQAKSTGFRDYNVMIIILESVSREHIGSLNKSLENGHYQGFTPFLDSLIRNGMYFDAFANGKTSIQGIPAILSGIPSLMNESFIQSNYAAGKYTSIAGLLKTKGYTTAFFHGGTNGTMGFDSYSRLVGFDRYFGRNEYNNEKDYDGKWGIRDEEFFQFAAKTLNVFKQPFAAAFFSLSSHHPYHVPAKYVNIFRTGKLPIQQSVMYADYSLGEFFHTAKHMPWYRNTLFVITADHTSEGYYPYYQSDVGQYAIPLLFFKPGTDLKGKRTVIAQQTDVMPTVMNYLGFDKSYLAFGTDLFDSTSIIDHFSIHYISGLYGLMKDGYYMEYDGSKCTALFNMANDPEQTHNLAGKEKEVQAGMERFIGAYIQQYNNRLIENRMTIDD